MPKSALKIQNNCRKAAKASVRRENCLPACAFSFRNQADAPSLFEAFEVYYTQIFPRFHGGVRHAEKIARYISLIFRMLLLTLPLAAAAGVYWYILLGGCAACFFPPYGHAVIGDMDAIVSSGIAGWGYPIRTQANSEYVAAGPIPA